jgi:hypothetical protein
MKGRSFEMCEKCERKKYALIKRGGYPSFDGKPKLPAFKTIEYFGSGGSAHKLVMVSQKLFNSILTNGIKGVSFAPVIPDEN